MKRKFKYGEKVKVRYSQDDKWMTGIYIDYYGNGHHTVTRDHDEVTTQFGYIKPFKKKKKKELKSEFLDTLIELVSKPKEKRYIWRILDKRESVKGTDEKICITSDYRPLQIEGMEFHDNGLIHLRKEIIDF